MSRPCRPWACCPRYRDVGRPVSVNRNIDWRGTAGERAEIGYLPEDHAAFVAGRRDLLEGILEVALQPPSKSMSFAHQPNLYWLPFLMTGDVRYVHNLEEVHRLHMKWRRRELGSAFGPHVSGRELAWNLRDLSQLAIMEYLGLTEGHTYIRSLVANRDRFLGIIANPDPANEMFRVLDMGKTMWKSYGFKGWMNGFVGMVTARMAKMGYVDFEPVAAWLYEGLERRIGHWGWKGFDFDGVLFVHFAPDTVQNFQQIKAFADQQTYETVTPFSPRNDGPADLCRLARGPLVQAGQGGRPLVYLSPTAPTAIISGRWRRRESTPGPGLPRPPSSTR